MPRNTPASPSRVLFGPGALALGPWQIVNDGVMGGASTSRFTVNEGTAIFEGNLSRANGGGFASVRGLLARPGLEPLAAFVVRVRGDGRRYTFTLRTDLRPNRPIHQCALSTKRGEWQEHQLSLGQFAATFRGRRLPSEPALDPAQIVAVGFLISDQQEGDFRLEIARIDMTSQKEPPPLPAP